MKRFVLSVFFLMNISFAASLITGASYFDTIYHNINSAHDDINISVSALSVDQKDSHGSIEMIRALQKAAVRGVNVQFHYPMGALPKDIVEKLSDQGVSMICNRKNKGFNYIYIDDIAIYGLHNWDSNSKKEKLAILLYKTDPLFMYSTKSTFAKVTSLLKKTDDNFYAFFSDIDSKLLKHRKKIYKQLLKKQKLNKFIMFSQKTIKKTEISRLFSEPEANVKDAMFLYEKGQNVNIFEFDFSLESSFLCSGSKIFFQSGADRYLMLEDKSISEKLFSVLKNTPYFKVDDIVKYN